MKSERDQEINDNLPLVIFILKKYFYNITEDMFQIGCIGLIKAVDTYDKNKSIKKSTYYGKCIFNEIANNIRRKNTQRKGIEFDEISLNEHVYDNLTYEDVLQDDSINVEETITCKQMIIQSYSKLNEREKYIIKYYFGLFGTDKKTQFELADYFNKSQAAMSREIQRILNKMRNILEGGEFPYL